MIFLCILIFLNHVLAEDNRKYLTYERVLTDSYQIIVSSYQRNLNSVIEILKSNFEKTQKLFNPKLISTLHLRNNESQCFKEILKISQALLHGEAWAYPWLDSIGKIPPGISAGAFQWYGSYELCKTLRYSNESMVYRGRYCALGIHVDIFNNTPIGPSIGICLPSSCSNDELHHFASQYTFLDLSKSYCHLQDTELQKDGWYYGAIVTCAILLFLLAVGTATEIYLYVKYIQNNSSVTLNSGIDDSSVECNLNYGDMNLAAIDRNKSLSQCDKKYENFRKIQLEEHMWLVPFCAYSLPYNAWKLCNTQRSLVTYPDGVQREHPLSCLDGIRFISMIWIIFGHTMLFSIFISNNVVLAYPKVLSARSFEVMINAALSVDTFFFMSGLLTVYLTLDRFRSVRTALGMLKFWAVYVLHRFMRLTPLYMLVLILYTGLLNHIYDGPFYMQDPKSSDIQFCKNHWYLIYLNNLVKSSEICMGWTWYMSNDMQFSLVLAPIFITLATWNDYVGLAFASSLVVSSAATYGIISYQKGYGIITVDVRWFSDLYVLPYTRWGAYAIGMILGWLLLRHPTIPLKRNLRNLILVPLVGIGIASTLCLLVVYGSYGVTSGELPPLDKVTEATYLGLQRPTFAIGLAITVYLCATRWAEPIRMVLSWSAFRIPARLTYGAYMFHLIVIYHMVYGSKTTFSVDTFLWVYQFFSVLCISYLGSFVLSMVSEAPVHAMERFIRRPAKHSRDRPLLP